MLWWMWVWSLDLDETFGADRLVAASSLIQIGRVVKKADWTLRGVFVEMSFYRLSIDHRIIW